MKTMFFAAYVTHPAVQGVAVFHGKTWEQAKQEAETAIDELIASWN